MIVCKVLADAEVDADAAKQILVQAEEVLDGGCDSVVEAGVKKDARFQGNTTEAISAH